MTNVESMDYTHSHMSIIASLFGTVHCPFSPRELVQTSPVHPNPVERAFPYFMFWMMMTTLCGLIVCYMVQVLDA